LMYRPEGYYGVVLAILFLQSTFIFAHTYMYVLNE
jgi:hypothetical protein